MVTIWLHVCLYKGKDECLTGKIFIPDKSDPKYPIRKTENNMAMWWIIDSRTIEVEKILCFIKQLKISVMQYM